LLNKNKIIAQIVANRKLGFGYITNNRTQIFDYIATDIIESLNDIIRDKSQTP